MARVGGSVVEEGVATFSSDSQLLSELGERLIATPEVALAELIKNAYDADATRCHIWLSEDDEVLTVNDDGHGMTEDAFLQFWMTIATPNRARQQESRRYGRAVTGSKGVGRFAVRQLGRHLELVSVAYDEEADEYRRLVAEFDWDEFEPGAGLQTMEVPYRIEADAEEDEEGTTLRISKLQEDWGDEKLEGVAAEVLDIVSSPFDVELTKVETESDRDPGFSVFFAPPGEESVHTSAAQELLDRYVAKVEIEVDDTQVTYRYEYEDREEREYTFQINENLVGDIEGEVRWYPRRKGVFKGMDNIDGRKAYKWVHENGGVRIIDNNFRMPPYGEQDDDWLQLTQSYARRHREWISPYTSRLHPDEELSKEEAHDPHLKLPRDDQLLGAVHVSSFREQEAQADGDRLRKLIPAMDRQGFVENEGMDQLRDIVRGSLEVLAIIDVEETTEKKVEETQEKKGQVTREIEQAKQRVQENPDLDPESKEEILSSYDSVEEEVEEYQEAQEEARTAVESMHLLGVVSGFISHETDLMLGKAKEMLGAWKQVPEDERDDEFQERLQATEKAIESLEQHLDYSKTFLGNLRSRTTDTFKVRNQVDLITDQFESYTKPRGIKPENKVNPDLESPEVNISVYSGVLLNLYSNAIKAVLSVSKGRKERRIQFDAENEGGWHHLRVSDTGVGIPEELEDRIFDPIFSTTDVEGPLGPGMGLGLFIVRKAVRNVGGEIEVIEPPEGFETCFEVRLKR